MQATRISRDSRLFRLWNVYALWVQPGVIQSPGATRGLSRYFGPRLVEAVVRHMGNMLAAPGMKESHLRAVLSLATLL